MRLLHYLQRALSMPPQVTLQKAWRKIGNRWTESRERKKDVSFPTYHLSADHRARLLVPRRLDMTRILGLLPERVVQEKSRRILAREFDLLGSGPALVKYGTACPGLEGNRFEPGPTVTADSEGRWLQGRVNGKNLPESRRIWGLIEQNYEPIDWQMDFKSGYRWKENVLSRDIVYGQTPGADVKVPWELARMQHLPLLAWASGLACLEGRKGFEDPAAYVREYRNQILDFIALNPPRYGVNWVCTMDVAIRVANWLLAYDLFLSIGTRFDEEFEKSLARSVHEHAHHIFHHLEWDPLLRSNHYLADIAGLLWAAVHLPEGKEAAHWSSFVAGELAKEVSSQFHAEGSNFEASTSYHRLSAEMVVYATALYLGGEGADLKNFPADYWSRFQRMPQFTCDASLSNGRVAQMGDNDSGRFFKLIPVEDHSLDHRHLVAAFNGLLDKGEFSAFAKGFEAETEVIRQLAGGKTVPDGPAPVSAQGWTAYPEFGLYRRRKGEWDLAVRCGSVGQKGNGGHAHNDQLSFELAVNGVSLIVDPGTYVYTPLPEERNRFRSTGAHNTLAVEGLEQNSWEPGTAGLFRMSDASKAKAVQFDNRAFVGEHTGFGVVTRRTLNLKEGKLEGIDECGHPGPKAIHFHLAPGCQVQLYPPQEARVSLGSAYVKMSSEDGRWEMDKGFYSKAYGEKEPASVLVLRSSAPRVEWKIQAL